jgi:hypothetical protein
LEQFFVLVVFDYKTQNLGVRSMKVTTVFTSTALLIISIFFAPSSMAYPTQPTQPAANQLVGEVKNLPKVKEMYEMLKKSPIPLEIWAQFEGKTYYQIITLVHTDDIGDLVFVIAEENDAVFSADGRRMNGYGSFEISKISELRAAYADKLK